MNTKFPQITTTIFAEMSQLAAEYDLKLPQGLGTGSLFSNNFPSLLVLENGYVKQA